MIIIIIKAYEPQNACLIETIIFQLNTQLFNWLFVKKTLDLCISYSSPLKRRWLFGEFPTLHRCSAYHRAKSLTSPRTLLSVRRTDTTMHTGNPSDRQSIRHQSIHSPWEGRLPFSSPIYCYHFYHAVPVKESCPPLHTAKALEVISVHAAWYDAHCTSSGENADQ